MSCIVGARPTCLQHHAMQFASHGECPLLTGPHVATLNIESLEVFLCGGKTRESLGLLCLSPPQFSNQVVQYLAKLRYRVWTRGRTVPKSRHYRAGVSKQLDVTCETLTHTMKASSARHKHKQIKTIPHSSITLRGLDIWGVAAQGAKHMLPLQQRSSHSATPFAGGAGS
jgi:hypothetical protein